MSRQLELHPELGLVEVVQQYQKVELDQLKSEVEVKEAEVEGVAEQIAQVEAQLADLQAQKVAKESDLNDSKSDLEAGSSMVGAPAEGSVDTGSVNSDGSVEDQDEESASDATDIASESPSAPDFTVANY